MAIDRTKVRPKMPVSDRAKQFLPFAAVKGLEEALAAKEQALLREEKKTLSEESAAALDRRLRALSEGDRVEITAYSDAERRYLLYPGFVGKYDPERKTIAVGGTTLYVDAILSVRSFRSDGTAEE